MLWPPAWPVVRISPDVQTTVEFTHPWPMTLVLTADMIDLLHTLALFLDLLPPATHLRGLAPDPVITENSASRIRAPGSLEPSHLSSSPEYPHQLAACSLHPMAHGLPCRPSVPCLLLFGHSLLPGSPVICSVCACVRGVGQGWRKRPLAFSETCLSDLLLSPQPLPELSPCFLIPRGSRCAGLPH